MPLKKKQKKKEAEEKEKEEVKKKTDFTNEEIKKFSIKD